MNDLQKYEERFEEINKMNLTNFERDKAIAKLMSRIEKDNGGINKIISQRNKITEFYIRIRDERKF